MCLHLIPYYLLPTSEVACDYCAGALLHMILQLVTRQRLTAALTARDRHFFANSSVVVDFVESDYCGAATRALTTPERAFLMQMGMQHPVLNSLIATFICAVNKNKITVSLVSFDLS